MALDGAFAAWREPNPTADLLDWQYVSGTYTSTKSLIKRIKGYLTDT